MRKLLVLCLLLALSLPVMPAAYATETEPGIRAMLYQKLLLDFTHWSETGEAPTEDHPLPALTEMTPSIRAFLAEKQPGGVILFKNNLPDTDSTFALTQAIHDAYPDNAPAPMIAIDQEGGRVTRLQEGTSLPGNMALGATGDPDDVTAAYAIIAKEVAAVGFTVDFAPVLDVNSNPQNPVIATRSFGDDPSLVAQLGCVAVQTLEDAGVASVVKHFPGHGDTDTDSHSDLPVNLKAIDAVQGTDLYPFREALARGVSGVMTAHIAVPALDSTQIVSEKSGQTLTVPATLSRKIITGVLREEMGFDGVVFSDALNMGAIAKHFEPADALLRLFQAGVDVAVMPYTLMGPNDLAALDQIVDDLAQAVEDGRLDQGELRASYERIQRFKQAHPRRAAQDPNAQIATPEARAKERAIAQASIACVRGEALLPLSVQPGDKLLFLAAYENELDAFRYGVERLIREGKMPEVTLTTLSYTKLTEPDEQTLNALSDADLVVFVSEIGNAAQLLPGDWRSDYPLALVKLLNERKLPYAALSLNLPSDVMLLTDAACMLCLFNPVGFPKGEYVA